MNAIIVKGVTLTEVANQLLDKGYNIDKADETLQTIRTIPTDKKHSYTLIMYIRIKDSTATITGTFNVNMDVNFGGVIVKSENLAVANQGTMGSLYKKSFEDINNFALSFNKRSSI